MIDYDTYLLSDEWKQRRTKVLARCRGTCEKCRKRRAVHVHHISYDHFGNEPLEDLLGLCLRCHQQEHPDREVTGVVGTPQKNAAAVRWQALNHFVDCLMADMTPVQIKVWLVLFRDTKNGRAATSQRDIAKRAGCGLKFVNAAIKVLCERGLLKTSRKGGWQRGCSQYRVFGQASH